MVPRERRVGSTRPAWLHFWFAVGLSVVSAGSAADPYQLFEYSWIAKDGSTATQPGYADVNGRVYVGNTLDGTKKNAVIVVFGQSLATNSVNDTYTPSNAGVYNFNIYDGVTYQATYPMLGCSVVSPSINGNLLLRLGDKWISAGTFDRVYLVSASVGGSNVADWEAGGVLNHRIAVTFKRLAAAGLPTTAVLWAQGESETQLGVAQAAYASSLASVISTIRTYYSGPIFVNHESWSVGLTSANVTAAQDAAVDHAANVWAGANWDNITAAGRQQPDNTHFNATGADAAASALVAAFGNYGAPF
jgi:hypothetical protein